MKSLVFIRPISNPGGVRDTWRDASANGLGFGVRRSTVYKILILICFAVGFAKSASSQENSRTRETSPGSGVYVIDQTSGKGRVNERNLVQLASQGNEADILKRLTDGWAVNDRDKDGNSPLHAAAKAGHTGVAKVLLAAGADMDAKQWLGDTPLIVAIEAQHSEIVELLLSNGADPNTSSLSGVKPLRTATEFAGGKAGTVIALLKAGARPDEATRFHPAALFIACQNGDIACANALLDAGADIDRNADGGTALCAAAANGKLDVAVMLLKRRASLKLTDADGNTPLHLAVIKGNDDVAALLSDSGADANARNRAGLTPSDVGKAARRENAKTRPSATENKAR